MESAPNWSPLTSLFTGGGSPPQRQAVGSACLWARDPFPRGGTPSVGWGTSAGGSFPVSCHSAACHSLAASPGEDSKLAEKELRSLVEKQPDPLHPDTL